VPNRPWCEVSTVSSEMGLKVRLWSSDVGRRWLRAIGVRTTKVVGRLGLILVVMFTLVGGLASAVAASPSEASSHGVKRDERLNFNIPSQPLTDALYAYTSATGVEALASGELLANLRSAEIQGTFTADEALQVLLAGTGLVARFVDSGSFTLAPIQTTPIGAPAIEAPSDVPRYARYSTRVQDAVKRALCRQSETRPGYYRTAVQLWIAPSGAVARSILVGTTGDVDRDRALSDLFRTLSIGALPPADLPQPATLLILPRSQVADCASAGGAGGP
jgi:hypothetical protein